MIAGALLVADAGITLAWQEPVSAIYARIQQDRLGGEVSKLERTLPPVPVQRTLRRLKGTGRRIAYLARAEHRDVRPGHALGRIKIPRIDASYVIVEGTDTSSLQKGPGHYPATPLPGLHGTVAIAGHRTTYLAPFRSIDALKAGDEIELTMYYGRFVYRVEYSKIVKPSAVWITRPVGYDRLVLSACQPLYSSAQRIVVFARLVSTTPRGPALLGAAG